MGVVLRSVLVATITVIDMLNSNIPRTKETNELNEAWRSRRKLSAPIVEIEVSVVLIRVVHLNQQKRVIALKPRVRQIVRRGCENLHFVYCLAQGFEQRKC